MRKNILLFLLSVLMLVVPATDCLAIACQTRVIRATPSYGLEADIFCREGVAYFISGLVTAGGVASQSESILVAFSPQVVREAELGSVSVISTEEILIVEARRFGDRFYLADVGEVLRAFEMRGFDTIYAAGILITNSTLGNFVSDLTYVVEVKV